MSLQVQMALDSERQKTVAEKDESLGCMVPDASCINQLNNVLDHLETNKTESESDEEELNARIK